MPSELRVEKVSSTTSPYTPVFSTTGGALSHRNMIINGAMRVAQRGSSSTVSGFGTVDRFRTSLNGNDENATQEQHALTSSDTGPYEEGFRYSLKMINGNQTSGTGSDDRVAISTLLEAQDIASSGWDYTSSSSYITLSFWCKSSVAQNFYGRVTTADGTQQNYPFETGSLTAETWTKITKTIPGNSNLQFDNNSGEGLIIEFNMFRGTDKTGSLTLNTWATYNGAVRVPDMTSTWYTTNNATWELTGVQLERGQVATPFEHRSYGDELARCQRYFQILKTLSAQSGVMCYTRASGTMVRGAYQLATTMRTTPTLVESHSDIIYRFNGGSTSLNNDSTLPVIDIMGDYGGTINFGGFSSLPSDGQGGIIRITSGTSGAYLALVAEL